LIGSFKSGHLTVLFETRTCLPPLELTKVYSEDFLLDYEEFMNYEYSTVTIRNDEKVLCLLYLPLAEEIAPGVYRYKYSDGQIIEYYHYIGFVQSVQNAIQACLAMHPSGPKIVDLSDKKRNIRKKTQKAKATSFRKEVHGDEEKGNKKEEKENKKEEKKKKSKKTKMKKNMKRTHSSDIDTANILKGSAHSHRRFTRSMSKCS